MFKFKLQAVLHKRIIDEKLCHKEIARQVQIHNRLLKDLEQIQQNIEYAKNSILLQEGEITTGFTMQSKIINQKRYIAAMIASADVKQNEIGRSKTILAEKQQKLIQAHKARKTLEVLKEKAQKSYYDRFDKAEKTALEDTVLIHHFMHQLKK